MTYFLQSLSIKSSFLERTLKYFSHKAIPYVFILLILCSSNSFGQHKKQSFLSPSDSLNTTRLRAVSIGQGAVWLSSMVVLNQAWYANYPRSNFHLFNDIGEWNQIDKVGHAWSAYWGAQSSAGLFRWSGIPRKRAAIYGAGMGIAYESVIEILDGFSSEWGFSLGDMAANTSGSLLFASQEYAWGEQRIQFKFSAHRVNYTDPVLNQKANNLYGASLPERILKDYNGQSYWLSANLWSFAKQSHLPTWLNIAVGYGVDGLYGGYDNFWTDKKTGVYYDRTDIARSRQFYLSPDIDLSKIEWKGKRFKALKLLNSLKLKLPMPTLEYNTNGGLRMHAFYF